MTDDPDRHAAPAARTAAARAFGEVLLEVGDDPRTETLLAAASRSLVRTSGLARCGVYLGTPDSKRFRGRLGVPQAIDATVRRLVVGGASDAVTAEVVRTRRPVFVADARQDARMALAAPRAWNTASLLAVPVVDGGRVLGVFLLDGEQRAVGVTDATLAGVAVFGELVGRWLTRTRRANQLPTALRELEQERRAAAATARIHPRLAALARTVFHDGAVLRLLAEHLDREVVRLGAGGAVEIHERPGAGGPTAPPVAAATIAVLRAAARDLGIGGVRIVEPSLERGLTRRWVVAPVIADDEPRGLIAVAESATPIGRLDVELVRRVADVLGLGAERAGAARRRATDHRHLRAADRLGIVPRAARTSPPGEAPAVLVGFVLAPDGVALTAGTAAALEERLVDHRDGRDGAVLRTDDGLVVLVPAPGGGDPAELRRILRSILPAAGLDGSAAGIVHAHADELDLAPALTEARDVAAWVRARARAGETPVVAAPDLGAARLLLTPPVRVARMAADVLGPLLADDPGMADLLETLRTFFATGRSVRASSQLLGVHENTIRYRFNRTQRLIGLDVLGDDEAQLLVQAALVALPAPVRDDDGEPGDPGG